MFDLVFLFTGLCAFVPTSQSFDVVLLDATQHRSVLVVRSQQVLTPPTTLQETRYCDHLAYHLDDHVVRVKGASPGPVSLAPPPSDAVCPQSARDLESYSWVAPMASIVPGLAKIGSEFLNLSFPVSNLVRDTLAAKIELTDGSVSTRSVARNGNDIIRWVFHRGTANEFKMALADLVEFRSDNLTGNVVLEVVSFASGTVVDEIELASASLPDIVVEVRNQPDPMICSHLREQAPLSPADFHFGHFFSVLSDSPDPVLPEVDANGPCSTAVDDPIIPLCQNVCSAAARVIHRVFKPKAPANPQCPGADLNPP